MIKKKRIGRIIFTVILILIVAFLIAVPFLLDMRNQSGKAKASILSTTVKTGSIQKTFSGTGTITEQDAVEISVPDGVEVTEYMTENGHAVRNGDPVAAVNRASVMEAISNRKSEMAEIEEQLNSIGGNYYSYIEAPTQGRVKAVYAKAGDSVQEVMLAHGALAVLSLDGLMGVRIPDTAGLSIGKSVFVILSDGKEISGRVELIADGEATITIPDSYGHIDETVQIQLDGKTIGRGTLFVHSAWQAVASSGTVYSVFISENAYCWQDGILFSIKGPSDGSYERLLSEYRAHEEELEELFHLYHDGVFKAPSDGIVSGVEENLKKQPDVILRVTPQETVTVSVTVDELDILSVHEGQEALITLDALPGQRFKGIIIEVSTIASNEGGHSKYSAVVQFDRAKNMLGGMNASVSIITESLENITILPAEAVDERDGKAIVYTAYDTRSGALSNPITVVTGLSDGISVQILSGISEGEKVWYEYYEPIEFSSPTFPGLTTF